MTEPSTLTARSVEASLDSMSDQLPDSLAEAVPACCGTLSLVARDARGAVAGFVIAYVRGERVGEIGRLYVSPDRQGRGVGTALLGAIEDRLARGGCAEAILWTFTANRHGRVFYERARWRTTAKPAAGRSPASTSRRCATAAG